MGDTINPPVQKTCGNSNGQHALNVSTARFIVRNRSGTQIANINYEKGLTTTKPKQNGDDAIRLMPGDSIELVGGGATNNPKVNFINAVDGEAPVIEIIEFTS